MSVRIGSVPTRIRMSTAAPAMTDALVGALAGCTGASTSQGPGGDVPYVAPPANASAVNTENERDKADAEASEAAAADAELEEAINTPQVVRDTFVGLQATYHDGCTPGDGNCAYFLGRVNDQLTGLDKSMRADTERPDHFKEPLARISALRTTPAGDNSTANLEKHRKQVLGTRDRINTWMQGHPEDHR
ncbi:hypothetical protein [Streptomyces sp. NBC_01022]|uniref:hypothetical protein n=1 Tax=Streptomyces sp. NBC_01022 TaxID=2903723 RepID=UPI002DDA4524|nr:hypothetical protein [Streptomyces sp. NBC_01022]WRZ81982.1 hypothetical protein OG316_17805 [Streptomyces sp. NBC_01022]